jgi:hypothetical protein
MFSLSVIPRFSGLYLITRHFWKKLDIIFGEGLLDGDNRLELPSSRLVPRSLAVPQVTLPSDLNSWCFQER